MKQYTTNDTKYIILNSVLTAIGILLILNGISPNSGGLQSVLVWIAGLAAIMMGTKAIVWTAFWYIEKQHLKK